MTTKCSLAVGVEVSHSPYREEPNVFHVGRDDGLDVIRSLSPDNHENMPST